MGTYNLTQYKHFNLLFRHQIHTRTAMALNLVDTLPDDLDDDEEEEEEVDEVPTSGMLKAAKELAEGNAKILGSLVPAEPSTIRLEQLRQKYPQVGELLLKVNTEDLVGFLGGIGEGSCIGPRRTGPSFPAR